MKKTAFYVCFLPAFFVMSYMASKVRVSCNPVVRETNFSLTDVMDSLQIMFVSKDTVYDSLIIDAIKKEGYRIAISYPFPLAGNQLMIDSLNKADLVIVGRSSVSSDLSPSKDAWNKLIKVPLMLMSQHSTARDKLNWFNSTSMIHVKDTATIEAYTSV